MNSLTAWIGPSSISVTGDMAMLYSIDHASILLTRFGLHVSKSSVSLYPKPSPLPLIFRIVSNNFLSQTFEHYWKWGPGQTVPNTLCNTKRLIWKTRIVWSVIAYVILPLTKWRGWLYQFHISAPPSWVPHISLLVNARRYISLWTFRLPSINGPMKFIVVRICSYPSSMGDGSTVKHLRP